MTLIIDIVNLMECWETGDIVINIIAKSLSYASTSSYIEALQIRRVAHTIQKEVPRPLVFEATASKTQLCCTVFLSSMTSENLISSNFDFRIGEMYLLALPQTRICSQTSHDYESTTNNTVPCATLLRMSPQAFYNSSLYMLHSALFFFQKLCALNNSPSCLV